MAVTMGCTGRPKSPGVHSVEMSQRWDFFSTETPIFRPQKNPINVSLTRKYALTRVFGWMVRGEGSSFLGTFKAERGCMIHNFKWQKRSPYILAEKPLNYFDYCPQSRLKHSQCCPFHTVYISRQPFFNVRYFTVHSWRCTIFLTFHLGPFLKNCP